MFCQSFFRNVLYMIILRLYKNAAVVSSCRDLLHHRVPVVPQFQLVLMLEGDFS